VLASSDIVSVNVPLNDQTRGLLGAEELLLMPRHALLINTSRGYVVDQPALTDALVEAGSRERGSTSSMMTSFPWTIRSSASKRLS
jgi:phosphoglycerate dehydrogenase-like enzyme